MSADPRPYEFDPAKAAENLAKHGVSFAVGWQVLQVDPARSLDFTDDRCDYGEERWVRIAPHPQVPSLLIYVAYTWRGEVPRLISVRKASRQERHRHAHRYEIPG